MHHIYHTEAFVLSSIGVGEDSKIVTLYTNELGLVRAKAQGLRKISSKLRFTLQNFSYAKVDLVRGREFWRVTTATPIHSQSKIFQSYFASGVLMRLISLITRLVVGEEKNEELFFVIKNMIDSINTYVDNEIECQKIELFYAAQILINLGYLSKNIFKLLPQGQIELPEEFADVEYRRKLVSEINSALSESHL